MRYVPNDRELEKLKHSNISAEVSEVLSGTPLNLMDPIPIKTEEQARKYLTKKVEKYSDVLPYTGTTAVVVDKLIAQAMNALLATGFTYANLYARDHTFLTEPHVASALAFNALNGISQVPDAVDLEFGLTYRSAVCV